MFDLSRFCEHIWGGVSKSGTVYLKKLVDIMLHGKTSVCPVTAYVPPMMWKHKAEWLCQQFLAKKLQIYRALLSAMTPHPLLPEWHPLIQNENHVSLALKVHIFPLLIYIWQRLIFFPPAALPVLFIIRRWLVFFEGWGPVVCSGYMWVTVGRRRQWF